MNPKKWKSSNQEILNKLHDSDDGTAQRVTKAYDVYKAESPRGCACVADAILDELLMQVFRKRLTGNNEAFNFMFRMTGPLGNYGPRLKMANLLGWFNDEQTAEAEGIHSIRNLMAHNLDVESFDHEAVVSAVNALTGGQYLSEPATTRERFENSAFNLMFNFWSCLDEDIHAPAWS